MEFESRKRTIESITVLNGIKPSKIPAVGLINDQSTNLVLAIQNEDIIKVSRILKKVDNTKDLWEKYPLHVAIQIGNKEIISLLISHGADVNKLDHLEMSPLHYAISKKDKEVTQLLLNSGANPNVKDKSKKSLLYNAIINSDVDVVRELVKHGADVNEECVPETHILHEAIRIGNLSVVKLVTKYININKVDKFGKQALDHAIKYQNYTLVHLFISYYADINSKNVLGVTPFHRAVVTNNRAIVKLLLERGANVNEKDLNKETPLHYAISLQTGLVELLMEYGANIFIENNANLNPADLMLRCKSHNYLDYLGRHAVKIRLLGWSSDEGFIRYLVRIWGRDKVDTMARICAKEIEEMKNEMMEVVGYNLYSFMNSSLQKLKIDFLSCYINGDSLNYAEKYPSYSKLIEARIRIINGCNFLTKIGTHLQFE